jgi:hypothetical protein
MRMFEKREQRIIILAEERKLHNEEFQNIFSSPSIIVDDEVKEHEVDRSCSTHEERRNECRVMWEKHEGMDN